MTHARQLSRLQEIFDRAGAVPTYFVDYPFAAQAESSEVLAKFVAKGKARLGTHLHPWVSPPKTETVDGHNSYPGNLPKNLERDKLQCLTETIEKAFGVRPRSYLAGRYGFGPGTAETLLSLGYDTDYDCDPFWQDSGRALLRIPHTAAHVGFLCRGGRRPFAAEDWPAWLHLGGILWRLGAMRRLRLSPEGFTLAEMTSLTRDLHAQGGRLFVLSLHSPSVTPGFTPYAQDPAGVDRLLAAVGGYLDFFARTLKGRFVGVSEIREAIENIRAGMAADDAD